MTFDGNGDCRPLALRGWLMHFASVVHLTWGILLLFSESVMDVAPIHDVATWLHFDHMQVGIAYLAAGAAAWWGAFRHKYDTYSMLLGVPQVLLLFMGMSSCIDIILNGVHPDGTTNSRLFFVAQLANSIWLPPLYMISVYGPYWRALWKSWRK